MTESARDTDEAASAMLAVQDPWFEVTQLSPGLFRITEPRCHRWVRANCFLILGRERDVLVDSGMGVAALRPILDRLSTLRVFLVRRLCGADLREEEGCAGFRGGLEVERESLGRPPQRLPPWLLQFRRSPCRPRATFPSISSSSASRTSDA